MGLDMENFRGPKNRRLATVDLDTGEVVDGVNVWFGAKVKWREGFFMQFQEMLEALAMDEELMGRPRRVLDYMMSKLSWENWIHIQQTDIAKALGMHKSDVSRCVSLLVKKRIILKGQIPGDKRLSAYKLNSHYGWKGKVKNLAEYRMVEDRYLRVVRNGEPTQEDLEAAGQQRLFDLDTSQDDQPQA